MKSKKFFQTIFISAILILSACRTKNDNPDPNGLQALDPLERIHNTLDIPEVRDFILPPGSLLVADAITRIELKLIYSDLYGYLPSLYASGETEGGFSAETNLIINHLMQGQTAKEKWIRIHNFGDPQVERSLISNISWIRSQFEEAKESNVENILLPLNRYRHATLVRIDLTQDPIQLTYYDSSNNKSLNNSFEKEPEMKNFFLYQDYLDHWYIYSLLSALKEIFSKQIKFKNHPENPQKNNSYCILYQSTWAKELLTGIPYDQTPENMEKTRETIETDLLKEEHLTLRKIPNSKVYLKDESDIVREGLFPQDKILRGKIWKNLLDSKYRELRGFKALEQMEMEEFKDELKENLRMAYLGLQRVELWHLTTFLKIYKTVPIDIPMENFVRFGAPRTDERLTEIIKPVFFKVNAEFKTEHQRELDLYLDYATKKKERLVDAVSKDILTHEYKNQAEGDFKRVFPK